MTLPRLALAALLALASPTVAQTSDAPVAEASVASLAEVMRLEDLFQVLRDEGVAHGETLASDMFPSGGGAEWQAAVSEIYDVSRLGAEFEAGLNAALADDPKAASEIVAFFSTDLGQRIIGLEIEARRAFLDTAAEEAAQVAADNAAAARDPKVAQIRRMIEACDMVEMNVAGTLGSNFAFMKGMTETGAYGANLPEDQLLSDTWAQEDQVRADLSTWLYSYLGLAYHPLTEAEMQTYVEFWESHAGQRLNAALFTAFDDVFRKVSFDLGRAAGTAMQGRDI